MHTYSMFLKAAAASAVLATCCSSALAASPPPAMPAQAPVPLMSGGVLPHGGVQPPNRMPGGAHPKNLHNTMELKSHVTSKPRCRNKVDAAHMMCGAKNRHG
jgi:hypothetical protein